MAKYWQERNRLLIIAKHYPEKLADALYGKGFFTFEHRGIDNDGTKDVALVIERALEKLFKEHGASLAYKFVPGLFRAFKKICDARHRNLIRKPLEEIQRLHKELERVWEEEVDPPRKGLDKLVCKDKEIKKLRRELKRVWDEVVDSRSKELESNKY
ncbi:MAG: hypothetical protein WC417_05080, partial [Candidatus Omnitrophota bacterium]